MGLGDVAEGGWGKLRAIGKGQLWLQPHLLLLTACGAWDLVSRLLSWHHPGDLTLGIREEAGAAFLCPGLRRDAEVCGGPEGVHCGGDRAGADPDRV